MKKLFAILAVLLLAGCDLSRYYSGTVTNHSKTYNVALKISNGPGEINLAPSESIIVDLDKKDHDSPNKLLYFHPEKRVYVKENYSYSQWDFYDQPTYKIIILNLTGKAGKLSADGWMDDISFTASPSEQTNNAWILYTVNPSFSVLLDGGFIVPILYVFEGDTFKISL